MMAINWKTSWPLVESAVASHNAGHVVGTQKDGKPRYDLTKVLRAPHQHLLKEMVRMYSRQLANYKWLHISATLPPYHTNCVALGRAMSLCKATIHNQLQRLLASGLVIEKEHRGRRNNFTLRFADSIIAIHPELLLRRGLGTDGDLPLHVGNQPLGWLDEKTLGQVPVAGSLKKENKLPVERVQNDVQLPTVAPGLDNGAAMARPSAGNPPFQDGQGQGESTKRANSHRARARWHQETPFQDSGKRGAVAEKPAPAPVSTFFEEYYIRLLAAIVGSLYRDIDFMAKSQLDAIKGFIHAQFEGKDREQGEAIYQQLWIRVGLAEKWVGKKPNRYIPLPGRYFAPDNPHGFNKTAVWLENMRMTNKRAEVARQRFQVLSKSVTAVLHSTGRHLKEGGIHSYVARRNEVADKYPHLATAFDWIVLDPTANPS